MAVPDTLGVRLGPVNPLRIRLQQPVEVDDNIFHFGIVVAALRRAAPGVFRGGIAVVDADQIDMIEVGELQAARILDAAAEDEVKLAHGRAASMSISGWGEG